MCGSEEVVTIYSGAVHLQSPVEVRKCLSELAGRESHNTTIWTEASCLSTKTADCLGPATPILPHSETVLQSSHSTTLNCMQHHAAPEPLYEPRKC